MNSPTDNGPMGGRLYVVATPIGNLRDITLRAIDTLKDVDLVAAEDTRHTARLLSAHAIGAPLVSCHEYNEQGRARQLVARMQAGAAVALVSDAGTPSVSDPGYRLVQAAIAGGVPVIPIPGPCAATAALMAAGLPTDAFYFIGFPPKKAARRRELLDGMAAVSHTLIFYESPKRILAFLHELISSMGPDRPAALCREMTKAHEEFIRGTLADIHARLSERDAARGEITLLVAGAPAEGEPVSDDDLGRIIRQELAGGDAAPSAMARRVAARCGVSRKRVYEMALNLKEEGEDHG